MLRGTYFRCRANLIIYFIGDLDIGKWNISLCLRALLELIRQAAEITLL